MLKPLTVITALLFSSAGYAQAGNQAPNPAGVYDSKGTLIGTYLYVETLVRQFPGGVYMLEFNHNGLITNTNFLFPAANCQGAGYLSAPEPNYLPQQAYFDGINIWIQTGPIKFVTYESSSYDGKCTTYSRSPTQPYFPGWYGAPATIIDSTNHGFHPPFSVSGS